MAPPEARIRACSTPIFPFDPALEVEHAAYALDVFRRPIGDLLVGGNLHCIETPLDQNADTMDALEVLRRRRTHHPIVRADCDGRFGAPAPGSDKPASARTATYQAETASPAALLLASLAGSATASPGFGTTADGGVTSAATPRSKARGECRIAAAHQNLRLLDPFSRAMRPSAARSRSKPRYLRRRPSRDLCVTADAGRGEAPCHWRVDATDALQIVDTGCGRWPYRPGWLERAGCRLNRRGNGRRG